MKKQKLLVLLLFFCCDLFVNAECLHTAEASGDDMPIVRILAVGNSYSGDAVERFLYDLAKDSGIRLIIGNACRGGKGLFQIWDDLNTGAASTDYRKIDVNGHYSISTGWALADILADEPWDYITFQQRALEAGIYKTYTPYLSEIIEHVRSLLQSPDIKFGLHMVWAFAQDSDHQGFLNYGRDQMAMYEAIVDASKQAIQDNPDLSFIVPCGTSIQNLRSSFIGDNVTRDGGHLNKHIGRYTAAYTWFASLFQEKATHSSFIPWCLNDFTSVVAKNAALAAVECPYSVTPQIYPRYVGENTIVPIDININFAYKSSAFPRWNHLSSDYFITAGFQDANGVDVGIIVNTENNKFTLYNKNGPSVTNTQLDMPSEVSRTALLGYCQATPDNAEPAQASIVSFMHMNKALAYDFTFFGSQVGSSSLGNLETTYQLAGADTFFVSLDVANNVSKTVTIPCMRPDEDGTITLTVSAGPNNNSPNRFYYLNALRISPSDPNDPNGIKDLESTKHSIIQPFARKVIRGKHLYIIKDNETYSVDGKRVE